MPIIFELDDLKNYNGVVVPGGFGYRGIEGKITSNRIFKKK